MHVAGVARRRRAPSSTSTRRWSATSRDVLVSELSGKATIREQAERGRDRARRRGRRAGVERLKEREHRGYHYEAADASFELLLRREAGDYEPLFRLESFRVITEKRADGEVETEATIKVWVDGERYVRTAEGNGPVNALDRALRDAIAERHPHLAEIELINYKVRILDETTGTGAVTRVLLDSSDGQRDVGHDRRLGEHHRGLLGGAGGLARVRLPARPRRRRPRRRRRAAATSVSRRASRSRSPGRRSATREEELGARGAALRPALARARCWSASSARSPPGSGSTTRSRSRAARPALHLGVRALGWGPGDEVVTSAVSASSPRPTACSTRARGRSSATSTR